MPLADRTIVVPVLPSAAFHPFAEDSFPEATDPVRFERAEFQLNDLFDSLHRQISVVLETGARPAHVLLGRDFFSRYVHCAVTREFSFDVPCSYGASTFGHMFAGLRVHCIPWMEGCVVLPDLGLLDGRRRPVEKSHAVLNEWGCCLGATLIATPVVEFQVISDVDTASARSVLRGLQQDFIAWLQKPKRNFLKKPRRGEGFLGYRY